MGVGREEGSSFFSSFVRSFESLALFPNQASTDLVSVGLSFPRSSKPEVNPPTLLCWSCLASRKIFSGRTNKFIHGWKERACVGNQKTKLI